MKSVGLPDHVWGRLASVAGDRGITVSDLLTSAVMEITKPRTRQEHILQLVREGLPDGLVAEHTGELKAYVGEVRRRAGLKPNRQWRTDNERKTA